MEEWTRSSLWKVISDREGSDRARLILQISMPIVEETLRSGMAASPDFTLHDAGHGFRVAEMASKLLGEDVALLTDNELSLLLLASYCHDIGMTPARGKVRDHFAYLVTGDTSVLSQVEIKDLQTWLDNNWAGLTPPVDANVVSVTGLRMAEEINAYYCRSRHNDWSEEWIRSELGKLGESLYPEWIGDLVTLCRSHHEGLAQLRNDRFNARLVGSPSTVLNLRFLAALLRVADVMEFAPERTPEVILRHRDIAPKSRIYWYKDHAISFAPDRRTGKVRFSARTPSAPIHKAVLMTAEWVDQELATCSTLEQEGAYKRGMIPDAARDNYRWPWSPRLAPDIREQEGKFVYIEGAFRPDSNKILSLLSGIALYKNPIIALRELIQNAIDAVQEQIAYERLKSGDIANDEVIDALAKVHYIRLSYYKDEDGYWIRCADNGSGMTKSIIEKNLLVSGSSTRGDVRALERDAQAQGFSLNRIGQFGIGVLSYFMLSDKMMILTRRSQEAGDPDGLAWKFTTEGIGAFGELAQTSRGSRGTEVSLRIRPDHLGESPETWFDSVVQYVASVIRWVPCRLEFRDEVQNVQIPSRGPGWTALDGDYTKAVVESLARLHTLDPEIATAEQKAQISLDRGRLETLRAEASKLLKLMDPKDFSIDDPEATGRVRVPYFQLGKDASAAFLHLTGKKVHSGVAGKLAFRTMLPHFTSWHGIKVLEPKSSISNGIVEIDYRRGRCVSVDRNVFVEASDKRSALAVKVALEEAWLDYVTRHSNSLFHELNIAVAELPAEVKAGFVRKVPYWLIRRGDSKGQVWRRVSFPLCDFSSVYRFLDEIDFTQNGIPLNEACLIKYDILDGYSLHRLYGGGALRQIDCPGLLIGHGSVGRLWSKSADLIPYDGSVLSAAAAFPAEWAGIVLVRGPMPPIFNRDHSLVKLASFARADFTHQLSATKVKEELENASSSPQAAAKFLLENGARELTFWTYLSEMHGKELRKVLKDAGITGPGQFQTTAEGGGRGLIDIHGIASGESTAEHEPVELAPEWKVQATFVLR